MILSLKPEGKGQQCETVRERISLQEYLTFRKIPFPSRLLFQTTGVKIVPQVLLHPHPQPLPAGFFVLFFIFFSCTPLSPT